MNRLTSDLDILRQEPITLGMTNVPLKHVLEAMVDGVILLNQHCEMLNMNRKAERLLNDHSCDRNAKLIIRELDWICKEIKEAQKGRGRKSPVVESEVLLVEGKILRIRAHYKLQSSDVSHWIWVFLETDWFWTNATDADLTNQPTVVEADFASLVNTIEHTSNRIKATQAVSKHLKSEVRKSLRKLAEEIETL